VSAPISSSGGWISYQPAAPLAPAVAGFLSSAGWRQRRDGAGIALRTEESYTRNTPVLITARLISGTGREAFSHLASLPDQMPEMTRLMEPFAERVKKLSTVDDLPSRVAEFRFRFPAAAPGELVETMRAFFADRAIPHFPGSKLLIVDMAQELITRYTMIRVLISSENNSAVLTTQGFPAGRALATSGVFGAQSFLLPALGALAPYVFGVSAARARATGVWLFGEVVPGAVWPSNQIIDSLKLSDARFTGPRLREGNNPPSVTADQLETFLTWWTTRVNEVLAIATDPTRFPQRGAGTYDPGRHWQYLASIERLFRDVGEVMLETEMNETAQLRASYDALDTLEGMRLGDFAPAVTPRNAHKALDWLDQHLPADVAAVALPACRRGVEALDQVKNGFTGRYVGSSGLIGLPTKNGQTVDRGWDSATAGYLRLDRNSAHSYMNLDPEDRALLLAHTGHLPRALAHIALLWLLRLLSEPQQLATKMPAV
jgi:hypothetical protein